MINSVVVRCLNEEQHIGRLLAGLQRQNQPPDEIVIVDSGSTDATLDIASRYTSNIVEISPDRFSFGRALNVGCDAAKGDVLIFVSAHVYPVYDSYIETLTAPFVDGEVALTYGRQVGDHRTKYSESRLMLRWFPATSTPRQDHPFCNNANAAIRRTVWESLPYDEDLTGLEDVHWAKRALAAGHAISYVAEAPVVHVHEEPWSRIVDRYERESIAYRRIMGEEKHLNAAEAAGLALGNTVMDLVHAARDGVLLPNLAGIPAFRVAQFYGAWRGFTRRDKVNEGLRRRFYYPSDPRPRVAQPVPGQPIDYSDYQNHPEPWQ